MEEAFVAIILAALVILAIYSAIGLSIAERRLKKAGVPLAVEIARLKGWVSSYRLIAARGMKEAQADIILHEACKRGLLHRRADGRYYLS